MANILPLEKQITVIGALAEGTSMRAIERLTGIHQDTICRLGVKVGNACARLMDEKMRGLDCKVIQMDEIWGFIGKKQKNLKPGDAKLGLGDVWTFVAIDAETKMVPVYRVGKRDAYTANCFVEDLADRLNDRVRLSTDGLSAYVDDRGACGGSAMRLGLGQMEGALRAVERAAECHAEHVESVRVVEMFRGKLVWQGQVEVFTLSGHPKTKRAYGWAFQDGQEARYVAVLEIPPVTSPNTAVRAAIAAGAQT